jgi:LPS-assembly lipoprotein
MTVSCSARKQEENLLYRDMQNDLVQQLMRRLAVARRDG